MIPAALAVALVIMTESTSAERLNYLLDMALTIHEGIVDHVEVEDELDKQLISHLIELDHFIVVKKALQGRHVNQPCSSDDELAAGGSTPPPSHQAPSTAGHAKKHSISPRSRHPPPSPSFFFSSPDPQGTRTSAPARRKATRRIQGETKGSKALRKMRDAVPYASWVDKPK
ncbi:hypothetical protein LB504_011002 [Fusarium proliferatum]|nr:hypothetical protein LB504_011002 [Fusarium proliferatum]